MRVCLVSSRLGTGKPPTFFYSVVGLTNGKKIIFFLFLQKCKYLKKHTVPMFVMFTKQLENVKRIFAQFSCKHAKKKFFTEMFTRKLRLCRTVLQFLLFPYLPFFFLIIFGIPVFSSFHYNSNLQRKSKSNYPHIY